MPFREPADVVVKQQTDEDWEVIRPLTYLGKQDEFVLPVPMLTDFASVPRVFVWLLPRYGRYTKAAVLHDFLWRQRAKTGQMSWREADATFRRAMRELEVAFLRRWIMWAAVRWGSLLKPGGRNGWWKDSWAVLLATAVALPVVAVPAVAILFFLAVFYVLELVFWVPLKVAAKLKTAFGDTSPRKEVNAPSLLLKL